MAEDSKTPTAAADPGKRSIGNLSLIARYAAR